MSELTLEQIVEAARKKEREDRAKRRADELAEFKKEKDLSCDEMATRLMRIYRD